MNPKEATVPFTVSVQNWKTCYAPSRRGVPRRPGMEEPTEPAETDEGPDPARPVMIVVAPPSAR